ncbi:hypothetical protein MM1218R_03180 [Mycobacterium marinum]|uniref:Uncharacterized protein n=1 Tax=Mycobacterium marinum TaxID=1781 RepID=A0A2Z5YGI8_MYCMR|nr:hypothetical protein MM1218R_03180 [Mycobacterium marinum]RFZ09465.1 hypothetical protein DE4381_02025 [Mycobacterium marinum]RFZ28249.1 hypothetical protein DSM43519_00558 [Mycobacterium marinum]RFZ30850.1 hypothetical protein DSM44344_00097 [Mycobacterium marinum]RFZ35452.1 hypothetical protein NCTC2275_02016 [Mycobacterium marinum]
MVRNGYHQEREVLTAAGAVKAHAPRVKDRRVDAQAKYPAAPRQRKGALTNVHPTGADPMTYASTGRS